MGNSDGTSTKLIAHEGASDQPILRADLLDDAGEFHEADKNLSERISNVNGQFEFR